MWVILVGRKIKNMLSICCFRESRDVKPYTSLGRNLGLCTWQTFCCTITCWISLPLQGLKLGGTEKVFHIQHSLVQVPKLIFQPVWPGWNYQSSLWHPGWKLRLSKMKSQSKVVFEKICSENQAEILAWLSRLKLITTLNRLNFTLFTHTQKFMVSNIHQ